MITEQGLVLEDKLDTMGFAPGYGDMTLHMIINDGGEKREVQLVFNAQDVKRLKRMIAEVEEYDRGLSADVMPLPDTTGLDAQYHCYQCQQDFVLPVGMVCETCPLCGSRDWQLPF